MQTIVLPRHGRVDEVIAERVYFGTLPLIVQIAIDAHHAAGEDYDPDRIDQCVELVVPPDLVTITSDLHACILSDAEANDEITEPCTEEDDAHEATLMFNVAWRELFFGENPRIEQLAIKGPCTAGELTLRVEVPAY